MTLGAAPSLGLAMRFGVTVDDIDLGNWATCQGLKVDFNPTAVDEGGTNDYQPWIPGALKYDKVKLTRVVSADDSGKVQTWLRDQSQAFRPGTASIVLYDTAGDPVMTWDLLGVVPATWEGPSLDANSSKFAHETLVLCHEGFL